MTDRLARIAAGAIVVLGLLLVPLVALQRGWLPRDDARRHAAMAIADRPWDQVVVIRPDAARDQHAAWHAALRAVHRATGADASALLVLSVVALAWLVGLAPLALLSLRRTPWEAWAAALALTFAVSPTVLSRWVSGRPLVVSMTALVLLLLAWREADDEPRSWRAPGRLAMTVAAVATATCLHGTWYLFALPVAAVFLARPQLKEWPRVAALGACWAAGSVLGAIPFGEGNPLRTLASSLHHAALAMGAGPAPPWRVFELEPSGGLPWVVAAAVAWIVLRRRLAPRDASFLPEWRDPAFILAAMGWVLGLRVQRFWNDWGAFGLAAWLAVDFGRILARRRVLHAPAARVIGAGLAAAALVAVVARDTDGRWSRTATEWRLNAADPRLSGWLPEPGGILYNERMADFYAAFLENPLAPWRYELGFEPGLMPPEDLAIYRSMQNGQFQLDTFQPWVDRLRPQDRLLMRWPGDGTVVDEPPPIPSLEWKRAGSDAWLGRLPRTPQEDAP